MQKADRCEYKTLEIIVQGRVQGVGYRYFTRQQAQLYGIRGTVKNQVDGSVMVKAQGENLTAFCERLREGPAFARVNELIITELTVSEKYEGFRIV
ncbi:MAG: acylphosphatase [Candidatus Cloacimonetes bacterium]|nr:acylphosphatase [Candidatus Cloacimonadota bacterium]